MGVSYGAVVTRNNLLLYLDPFNPKSYPGTGSVWYDLSGKNNNATLYNSPTFSSNNFTFNGSNQWAQITNNGTMFDGMRTEQTVIMCLWKNTFTSRQNPLNISYAGIGTWTHETNGYINSYYGNLGSDGGTSNVNYQGITIPIFNSGQWNIVAAIIKYPDHIWFSGTTKQTQNNIFPTLGDTNNNIKLGVGYTNNYWSGKMGHVLIYDKALTDEQYIQIYDSLKKKYGL